MKKYKDKNRLMEKEILLNLQLIYNFLNKEIKQELLFFEYTYEICKINF